MLFRSTNAVVKTFLDFEDATLQAQSPDSSLCSIAIKLERESQLDWSDFPIREDQSRVIQLSCELQQVIDAVAQSREPNWVYGPHFYVVPQTNMVDNSIYHVSARIAQVLQICDGRRTIYDVVTQLSIDIPEVPEPLRDYALVGLLEKARAEGLLAIYRTASEPAESQVGGFSIPEYSDMRAAASAQN